MERRDVVAGPKPQRSPDHRDFALAQQIAADLQVGEVAQFEGDVMHGDVLGGDEIHCVVVGVAAQEHEEVADPVRHPEAQNLGVKLCNRLGVGDAERDVAELESPDAGHLVVVAEMAPLAKQLDGRAFGILKRQDLGHAGHAVVCRSAADAVPLQTCAESASSMSRGTSNESLLQRACVPCCSSIASCPRRDARNARLASRPASQTDHLRVVLDRLVEIRRLEGGMSDTS